MRACLFMLSSADYGCSWRTGSAEGECSMAEQKPVEERVQATWVWSWGAGTHGQLASGDFVDSLEPLPLHSFGKEINGAADASPRILDMACGGAHAVAVLGIQEHGGQVVTWGNGHSGALGHGNESDLSIPKLVTYFDGIHISSVAAGWGHTAFVATSGELYTCGDGSFGQLGHGDWKACWVPSKVMTLCCKTVSMAACGMRHTLVLAHGTSEGSAVYAFGSSKRGQLGVGTLYDLQDNDVQNMKKKGKVCVPEKISALSDHRIVLLAANGDCSAALSETGGLYFWGRGFKGRSDDLFVPAQVQSPLRFSQVALGWNHIIGLTDGQLWALGSNVRGQLGIRKASNVEPNSWTLLPNKTQEFKNVPNPVSSSENIETVIEETHVPSSASVVNVCMKQQERMILPQSISRMERSCEGKETLSSVVVTNSDQLNMCGKFHKDVCKSDIHWPEMLKVVGLEGQAVSWLSAGAEHSAVVLEDGRILTWGWGEHGQLGLGTVEDQPYPEFVPIAPSPFEGKLRWRTFCGSGFTFAVAEHLAQAYLGPS